MTEMEDEACATAITTTASTRRQKRRPRVLLGVTGSVAAVKAPELAVRLAARACDVRILLTRGGANFWSKAKTYNPNTWARLEELLLFTTTNPQRHPAAGPGRVEVLSADDEWEEWKQLGDPVLHVDLRDWADVLLVAPLSAHTLAKLSGGLCDDTLSCVVRAWDLGHHPTRPGKPILLAPAMNTAMWDHPITAAQLETIKGFWNQTKHPYHGIAVVAPQVKELACGEIGNGALAPVETIVEAVDRALEDFGQHSTAGVWVNR